MLVFSLKLHISPEEMGKMYFYDIMMLHDRYSEYVKEENEAQENQQRQYEEQYQQQQHDPGDMMRSMSKNMPNYSIPNMDSLTKGFNY